MSAPQSRRERGLFAQDRNTRLATHRRVRRRAVAKQTPAQRKNRLPPNHASAPSIAVALPIWRLNRRLLSVPALPKFPARARRLVLSRLEKQRTRVEFGALTEPAEMTPWMKTRQSPVSRNELSSGRRPEKSQSKKWFFRSQ